MRSDATAASARISVIGAGTMGVGIAYVFALNGHAVSLVDPDKAQREKAVATLASVAADACRRGKIDAVKAEGLARSVLFLSDVLELPEDVDLAIETVPERMEIKRDVLRRLSSRHPAIIASNTSALSIDALAEHVDDPGAFLGMHFFNPVWSLHLVELVRGSATRPEVLERAGLLAKSAGKTTIGVTDTPGFATSRLDLIAAMEAIRMVEDGVASPEDIDLAMTLAYRHPIGPLRLSDIVGLDVRLDIARNLAVSLGPRYAPPRLLEEMVARGELGRKSGKGFFDWPRAAGN